MKNINKYKNKTRANIIKKDSKGNTIIDYELLYYFDGNPNDELDNYLLDEDN